MWWIAISLADYCTKPIHNGRKELAVKQLSIPNARRPFTPKGKRVRFQFHAPPDAEVFVAGTFSNWNPRKLSKDAGNGTHSVSLIVPLGKHEYKFIVNGRWLEDPRSLQKTPNAYGSTNSVLHVA